MLRGATLFTLTRPWRFLVPRRDVWTVSAMQNTRVVVAATGEYIPQRVVSEPLSVTWVAVGKAINTMTYRHYPRIPLALLQMVCLPLDNARMHHGPVSPSLEAQLRDIRHDQRDISRDEPELLPLPVTATVIGQVSSSGICALASKQGATPAATTRIYRLTPVSYRKIRPPALAEIHQRRCTSARGDRCKARTLNQLAQVRNSSARRQCFRYLVLTLLGAKQRFGR
jgi:hypothetical protein